MTSSIAQARLDLDPGRHARSFNREPFGFTHNLSELDLLAFDSLSSLAKNYEYKPKDYFVSPSAPSPGAEFYSVPTVSLTPLRAIERLDRERNRVLLKRPEDHDPRFRVLLEALFRQVVDLRGGLRGEKVVRLESAILISSASSTTPFHFDPEIGFFSQIEGEKIYHLYPPDDLTEEELERFYIRGVVNIGQVAVDRRDPGKECVFSLAPGLGLHQPQNAPHWVETRGTRSISYTMVFETDATRAAGRVRAFNHCARRLSLTPSSPGSHPRGDAMKSGAMRAYLPVRKRIGRLLGKALGR